MRLKTLLALILLTIAGSVSAQTATPTPDGLIHCEGAIYIPLVGWFGGVCTYPDDTSQGGGIELDNAVEGDLYSSMATAAAVVNSLPEQINNAAPGGQSLVDAMAGAKQVFGYIKWLFSPNSAQELLGRSLAPIGINILVIVTMIVALTAIYIAINTIVYIVKFVIWLITQALKLVPFF